MRADNSSHLAEAAHRRRLDCTARVHAVLDSLERDGGAVTIAGVASRAGVSRTFLYDDAQTALMQRLRAIAAAQPGSGRPALPETQRISTKSHESLVRALRAANSKLRQENEQLRNELAVALGQLRDLRRGLPVLLTSLPGPGSMINGHGSPRDRAARKCVRTQSDLSRSVMARSARRAADPTRSPTLVCVPVEGAMCAQGTYQPTLAVGNRQGRGPWGGEAPDSAKPEGRFGR